MVDTSNTKDCMGTTTAEQPLPITTDNLTTCETTDFDEMDSSTNLEKQCRSILLLTRAGEEMLRGVVLSSVAASRLSLDDLLKVHRPRITRVLGGRERRIRWTKDVLFPPDGSSTDIKKWELNVLCFVVIYVFSGNLDPKIIDNVKDLKSIRNKLYHAAEMTDEEHDTFATDIEKIVNTCCRELNNDTLLIRVESIVKRIKDIPLSLGDCVRILREISERLIGQSHDNKEIKQKLDLLIGNLSQNVHLSVAENMPTDRMQKHNPKRHHIPNGRGRDELKPWTTRRIWEWDEVAAGKFVYLKYYGLWHAALVTGTYPDQNVVQVVHFALPRLFSSHVVREEEITVDLVNEELWEVFVPSSQRVSAAEAVNRAQSMIGKRGFNMFYNRSSHMVKKCVLGK